MLWSNMDFCLGGVSAKSPRSLLNTSDNKTSYSLNATGRTFFISLVVYERKSDNTVPQLLTTISRVQKKSCSHLFLKHTNNIVCNVKV